MSVYERRFGAHWQMPDGWVQSIYSDGFADVFLTRPDGATLLGLDEGGADVREHEHGTEFIRRVDRQRSIVPPYAPIVTPVPS